MIRIFIGTVFITFVMSVPVYADGGGPILLMINFYLFIVGQIWIILSELIYLKLLHNKETWWSTLKTVVLMNLLSMILGGLALPFLLALGSFAFGFLLVFIKLEIFANYILAAGTWIGVDNSPLTLALVSTGVGFIGTYFITVNIERRYLAKRTSKGLYPATNLWHCYSFNGISYACLIFLMFFPPLNIFFSLLPGHM